MAIHKSINLDNGTTASYWRACGDIRINPDSREASFVMAGYKDEETRRKTNAPMRWREIQVREEEFDRFFSAEDFPLFATLYAVAKEKDAIFVGATDA